MSDLTDFIQSYWFELGSLIAQFGILAVIAWYARTSLRITAASQRRVAPAASRVETRIELSPEEEDAQGYGGVGRILSPMPGAAELGTEPRGYRHVERVSLWRAMVAWLQAPIGSGRSSVA